MARRRDCRRDARRHGPCPGSLLASNGRTGGSSCGRAVRGGSVFPLEVAFDPRVTDVLAGYSFRRRRIAQVCPGNGGPPGAAGVPVHLAGHTRGNAARPQLRAPDHSFT